MSVGVVFHRPSTEEALRQWEYVLCHFQPDVFYFVGERPEGLVYNNAVLISDSSDLPAGGEVVLLAPLTGRNVQGTVNLVDFTHPTDAVYWFGPDLAEHMDPDKYLASRGADHLVYVPTDTDDQMFSHVTCAVVLWDRRRKAALRR